MLNSLKRIGCLPALCLAAGLALFLYLNEFVHADQTALATPPAEAAAATVETDKAAQPDIPDKAAADKKSAKRPGKPSKGEPTNKANKQKSLDLTTSITHARALSMAFRNAAAKALPSVVTVYSTSERRSKANPLLDIIREKVGDTVGSGVIIRADGLILTNHHVVADAKQIEVILQDGRRFEATETKSDIHSDLAIIKVDTDVELPTAEIGNSNDLFVGDWVLAIGSPFEIEGSVSAGIISATGRLQTLSRDVRGQFLQTDSAINPGNSGGPLVDLEGRVVGINTAISSRSGGFEGIGFAIPISRAVWIKNELLTYDRVRRGFAGIGVDPVPYSLARELHLGNQAGALVARLTPDRPGVRAGVKRGDIIMEFAGSQIQTYSAFAELVQQSPIGEPLPLVVLRDGKRVELTIELVERPE